MKKIHFFVRVMQGLFAVLGTGMRVYHLVIPFIQTATWEKLSRFGPGWNKAPPLNLVDRFSHIVKIELGAVGLLMVPADLGKLENLKFLNLHMNHLRRVPAEWGAHNHMQNLEELFISDNYIEHLPPEWGVPGSFPRLLYLDFADNPVTELPGEWGTAGAFEKLFTIYAEDLELRKIPDQWGDDGAFPSLKTICVSDSWRLPIHRSVHLREKIRDTEEVYDPDPDAEAPYY